MKTNSFEMSFLVHKEHTFEISVLTFEPNTDVLYEYALLGPLDRTTDEVVLGLAKGCLSKVETTVIPRDSVRGVNRTYSYEFDDDFFESTPWTIFKERLKNSEQRRQFMIMMTSTYMSSVKPNDSFQPTLW